MPIIDPLRPIIGTNRDEHMIVDIEGFIWNPSEILVLKTMKDAIYAGERYPGLHKYWNMSSQARYNAVYPFTPKEILDICSENIPENEIESDLLRFNDIDIQSNISDTTVSFALSNLVEKKFVKSVTFLKSIPFDTRELDYIAQVICAKAAQCEIKFVEGDIESVLEDRTYTTIFSSDIKGMLNSYLKYPEKLKSTATFLRKGYSTKDLIAKFPKGYAIYDFEVYRIDNLIIPNEPLG